MYVLINVWKKASSCRFDGFLLFPVTSISIIHMLVELSKLVGILMSMCIFQYEFTTHKHANVLFCLSFYGRVIF